MSVDYYYVCPEIKAYMPAFTFKFSGLWHAHFDGLLDWTSMTSGKDVFLIVEQSPLWDQMYDEKWKYINPYERKDEGR